MTSLFGSARSLQQGIAAWAVNGLGLAMVRDLPLLWRHILPSEIARFLCVTTAEIRSVAEQKRLGGSKLFADGRRTRQLVLMQLAQRLGTRPCKLAEWPRRWKLRLW